MADFQVTPASLLTKAEELETQNAQLKAQITKLEEIALRLNGMATWEGEAKDSFRAVFEKDKDKLTSYCNVIQQYIQVLRATADNYIKAENQNIERMNAERRR